MQTDHYYVYLYGSLRKENVSLDEIMKIAGYNTEHMFFLKHHDQLAEMGGIGLMYGVELKLDTFKNWQECSRFMNMEAPPGFQSIPVHRRKRLPNLVISNYLLPNIMGI